MVRVGLLVVLAAAVASDSVKCPERIYSAGHPTCYILSFLKDLLLTDYGMAPLYRENDTLAGLTLFLLTTDPAFLDTANAKSSLLSHKEAVKDVYQQYVVSTEQLSYLCWIKRCHNFSWYI